MEDSRYYSGLAASIGIIMAAGGGIMITGIMGMVDLDLDLDL